ncbi:uncharacterized protein LOC124389743 isoform X3 [Silurus meridionalis]|uniref:uncharacterized protein LOC124389743 isoform X3 n=1 Tax=Silurus meridionalis TaxID=175797 RepID=UPI001EEB8DF4|nr:uncharacterized protein LOC124389743 isoform X3 [Silurus meridionalis]
MLERGMHCHMVPTSDCLLRLQCDPLRTASETSQPTTAKRPRIDAAQHKHNKTRSLIACALETLHDASYDLLSNSVSALLKGSCKLPGLTDEEKSVTSAFCLNKDPPGNICSTITNTLKALLEDKRLTFQKSSCGEDLYSTAWDYVFSLDLLCAQLGWMWTDIHVIQY